MRRLIALSIAVLLSGCAQIPTGLDVKSGPEVASQVEQEFAYYTPSGPAPDASQQQIVSGFLAAGTGPQNDYSVAREFLSKDFAQRWKPDAAVLIRSGLPDFREVSTAVQIVSLNITAKLDEHGRYLDPASNESISLRFQLIQEEGEWRISSAPNLTVVTAPVFAVVFQPYNIYFYDSQQRRLVPDSRWFPSRASTGTRLVNALLAGPSEWMRQAVQSAIPAGTKLTIDAVRVEAGVAQVDFDSSALSADAIARRLMLSQLRATLLQLGGVDEVAIYVNSSPQDILPATVPPIRNGSEGMALLDGVFRISSGLRQPLPGTASFVENFSPTLFAVNAQTNSTAFASSSGVYLVSGTGLSANYERISTDNTIAGLDFDSEGLLWVIPAQSGSEVRVFDGAELVKTLVLPALGDRLAAELSPDGARLGVLIRAAEENRVDVFSITRDVRDRPSMLYKGFTLENTLGTPISFTWQSGVSLRVIERTTSGSAALSEYPLAGPRTQLPSPPVNALKIVSGSNAFSTYLLGDNREVWALAGGSWRRTLSQVTDIGSAG